MLETFILKLKFVSPTPFLSLLLLWAPLLLLLLSVRPWTPSLPAVLTSSPGCSPLLSRLFSPPLPAGSGPVPGLKMSRWSVCCCLLSLVLMSRALELEELLLFGPAAGDQELPPGSDSTAELRLDGEVLFFKKSYSQEFYVSSYFIYIYI